jgi:hypothetical protein
LVELGERHNKMHRAENYKSKTQIQTSNKMQPQWTQTQQGNWQTKIVALRAIRQRKMYIFLAFSVELGTKTKTNYKAHKNTSMAIWNLIPLDERLVPDLPRGRGRSIGGDLDVGEEGSEHTIVTLQSLHHGSIGYQHVRTRVDLAKKAYPCKCNREHKQEQEWMQQNLQMNVSAHECGAL